MVGAHGMQTMGGMQRIGGAGMQNMQGRHVQHMGGNARGMANMQTRDARAGSEYDVSTRSVG